MMLPLGSSVSSCTMCAAIGCQLRRRSSAASGEFRFRRRARAGAPPLWARHYELETDRPVFAGRDGVKRYALADIERERRTGTPWYGSVAVGAVGEEYPQWQRGLER